MSCRRNDLGETKESEAKEPETRSAPKNLPYDGWLNEVERSKKNGELRQVKESMSSSWIHGFGNPPVGGCETVIGDHSSTGRVEDEIEGHSRKDDSENRPSKSVPAGAHK